MSDPHSFDSLQRIANTLAVGFQALLDQVDEQRQVESQLRLRLKYIAEKYEQLDKSCNSSSGDISDWRDHIVNQIDPLSSHQLLPQNLDSNQKVIEAKEVLQLLNASAMPAMTQVKRCPVTHKTTDQEDFEHDFTTPGRIGDLGCPFAKMNSGLNPCGPDPIAEEFHGEKESGRSKSSGAANSRCPIRFLDKHSPEEVAQYFENHKHEIPRSHQICVKRYQENENSIRELDAKYGNLVSMIQGLGNKHKQYLPEQEKVADEPDQMSTQAVERWAENVSDHPEVGHEAERVPHFERPLRDVRVGESPSRPWGISVPVGKSAAASAAPSETGLNPSVKALSAAPAPAPIPAPAATQAAGCPEQNGKGNKSSTLQPQIVFNGPVFFGYSAEQAALFLRNLNAGNSMV